MINNDNQQAIDALKDVALEGIREQRASRRWRIFFRIATLLILLFLVMAMIGASQLSKAKMVKAAKYTAVVDIKGPILQGAEAGADNIISALQDAFEDKKVAGVVLRCNSPGGSPVQSAYVYDEIKRLREIHKDTQVIAVASDICASGGYYMISAADEIYANKSSLVGSIGVRMQSFGVVEAMKKIGVESRELTAGENKAILDPFSPRNAEDEAFVKELLATTHTHFIDAVKAGRGERLKDNPDIFSGLFWTGEQAKDLGLVDGFGSAASIAREKFDAEVLVNFSPKRDFFDRLSKRVSAAVNAFLLESQNSTTPILYK